MHGSSATKRAVTSEEKERLLKNDKLDQADWQALADVMAILKKVYDLTIRAEGTHIRGTRGHLVKLYDDLKRASRPRTAGQRRY